MPAKSTERYALVADDPNVEFRIVDDAARFALKPAKGKRSRKKKATAIDNSSGIWPTEFNVLVKQKEVESKIGSIYIPDVAKEKEQYAEMEGTLIAISPLAFCYERWPDGARKPQTGDRVIIAKYSGVRVRGDDGGTYLLTKDRDIAAVRA